MAEQARPVSVREREQYRRNAAGQALTGGVALGAATGADKLLNDRLAERKAHGVMRATGRSVADRFRKKPLGNGFKAGTHLPHLAGKLVVRGGQVSSLPLIAVGVRGMVKPKENRKVDLRDDVIAPTIRNATLADQVERAQERGLSKRLTPREQERLDAHRGTGRTLSLASGTMGLSALALRAPQAAGVAVKRGVKGKALRRLANQAEAATKHSNTLGVLAIGTGSAGSFNYAAQQKLERKAAVTDGGIDKAVVPRPVRRAVSGYMDRRATRVLGDLLPEGADFGGGTSVANIRPNPGVRPRWGSRPLMADVTQGGKRVGEITGDILPTKHVHMRTMELDPKHQGKGIASRIVDTAQARLPKARTPGLFFHAGAMKPLAGSRGENKIDGFTAWRKKGVKYIPGAAYRDLDDETYTAIRRSLSPAEGKKLGRHIRRANLGLAKPTDVKSMSERTQGAMSTVDWYGVLPGGQPMLGKTKRVVGAGTVVGGAGYGAHRWEEHKHPRQGGQFARKPGVAKGFLTQYHDRISPDAERGYRVLRQGEYEHAAQSAGNMAMAGLAAWGVKHEATQPKPVNKPAVAAYLTGGALSGVSALQTARTARSYRGKRKKIEAKARSRRAQGLYAPGRDKEPVDTSSKRFGKAAGLVPPAGGAAGGLPRGAAGRPGAVIGRARADNLAAAVSGGPR